MAISDMVKAYEVFADAAIAAYEAQRAELESGFGAASTQKELASGFYAQLQVPISTAPQTLDEIRTKYGAFVDAYWKAYAVWVRISALRADLDRAVALCTSPSVAPDRLRNIRVNHPELDTATRASDEAALGCRARLSQTLAVLGTQEVATRNLIDRFAKDLKFINAVILNNGKPISYLEIAKNYALVEYTVPDASWVTAKTA